MRYERLEAMMGKLEMTVAKPGQDADSEFSMDLTGAVCVGRANVICHVSHPRLRQQGHAA
jgi:hypothetical protein